MSGYPLTDRFVTVEDRSLRSRCSTSVALDIWGGVDVDVDDLYRLDLDTVVIMVWVGVSYQRQPTTFTSL